MAEPMDTTILGGVIDAVPADEVARIVANLLAFGDGSRRVWIRPGRTDACYTIEWLHDDALSRV